MTAAAILNFFLGHNLGVDQTFCITFGIVKCENQQCNVILGQ